MNVLTILLVSQELILIVLRIYVPNAILIVFLVQGVIILNVLLVKTTDI